MQEKSERIALWDNLKFLLIILVVMGHSLGNFMFQNDACKGVYIFIYFFHMPAFIFISGLFSKKTIKENKISKVTPYLLIYLLIKIISYLLQYGISGKYVPIDFLSESESPWFCLALFFMYIITMYTKRFRKGYVLTLALLLSCLAGYSAGNPDFLVWLRTVTFYPFFYLGYIWEPELIKERLCNIKFRVASVILLAAAFCLCVAYNNKFADAYNLFTGRHFYSELHGFQILGGVFRLGTFIVSLLLIFSLISIMPRGRFFFSGLGQRTLAVYVFHGPVIWLVYTWLGMKRLPDILPYGWQLMIPVISVLITLFCSNFLFHAFIGKILSDRWKLPEGERGDAGC